MKKPAMFVAAIAAAFTTFAAHSQETPVSSAAQQLAPSTHKQERSVPAVKPMISRAHANDPGMIGLLSYYAAAEADQGSEPGTRSTSVVNESRKSAVVKLNRPGKSGKYHDIVARYASAYGVPTSLAHAVVRLESNYRANARGRAGEIGLMQIKHSTARGMGYTGSAKGLYDPETNIKYGMKYLAQAHKLGGGNTCGTILRYNAGHGAKRMNPISAAYCAKVKRLLGSS